jgi:hypothetical protein
MRSALTPGKGDPAFAGAAHVPRTLEELGVPRPLAADLEAALRVMGMVEGDRIVGLAFRTPDGALHALRPSLRAPAGFAEQAA